MNYDLHCHSTASDGALSPTALVARAKEKGVTHLALTDHDTVSGLKEAQTASETYGIDLINGIELSTQWKDYNIHMVGLNFDLNNERLNKCIEEQKGARGRRYLTTLEIFSKHGIEDTEKQIETFAAGNPPSRPNFAKFLVENGHMKDYSEAYESLSSGGKFYVNPGWEYLEYAVKWINNAGGVAILAHPDKYGLSKPGLKGLIRLFKDAGGKAIEVCYGAGSKAAISKAAHLAREYELLGSVGSDFHRPGQPGIELGKIQALPKSVKPIWECL